MFRSFGISSKITSEVGYAKKIPAQPFTRSHVARFLMILESIIVIVVLVLLFKRLVRCPIDSKPLVQVVVLGDVGHSPRMQYHALSLADTGKVSVELIGFSGSKPLSAVTNHADIRIRHIAALRFPSSWKVPFVVYAAMKVIVESTQLFFVLIFTSYRPECVLLQCPPAVPSLGVCGLVCLFSGSKLVVDYHNITHMHLGSKVKSELLVSLVRIYESWLSRLFVYSALCVSKAMKQYLESEFGLGSSTVHVLYDRAGPQFTGRTSASIKHDLEDRLMAQEIIKKRFSVYDFVIASSTSWTPDEDFDMLLEALVDLSAKTVGKQSLLFITGKGEMKDSFVKKFDSKNFNNLHLVTAWVSSSDYPLVLGAADVGVCLHTSTSGLDLPMKVVDMLGSECPVLALKFPALQELLGTEGGSVFSSAKELSAGLLELLVGAQGKEKRDRFSRFGAKFRQSSNWKSEWMSCAWNPVFDKLIPKRSRQSRRRRIGS